MAMTAGGGSKASPVWFGNMKLGLMADLGHPRIVSLKKGSSFAIAHVILASIASISPASARGVIEFKPWYKLQRKVVALRFGVPT